MKVTLTKDSILVDGIKCHRIVACKDFDDVKKGDLGGYLAETSYLSQNGTCWIYPGAIVGDGCNIINNAKVRGESTVKFAHLMGNAEVVNTTLAGLVGKKISVSGNAYVCDSVIYECSSIGDNTVVFKSILCTDSFITGNARVYDSTFIEKLAAGDDVLINKVFSTCRMLVSGRSILVDASIGGKPLILEDISIRNSQIDGDYEIIGGGRRIHNIVQTFVPSRDKTLIMDDLIGE